LTHVSPDSPATLVAYQRRVLAELIDNELTFGSEAVIGRSSVSAIFVTSIAVAAVAPRKTSRDRTPGELE
jgi:hypothetical protein